MVYFINFPKPDRKTITLITFIIIESLAYFINILIDGIKPFESKFFDQICQSLFFLPIIIYKIFIEKYRIKKGLIKRRKKTKQFKKLDYLILTFICFIDLIANLCFIIFDEQFEKTFFFLQ